MQREIRIAFPGKKRVDAIFGEFTVHTDQRPRSGGEGTAPQPFDLFFVSLATCAGISALDYAQKNSLPTEGLDVTLVARRSAKKPRYENICINVKLPHDFPEEHVAALLAEVDDCSVKRHVLEPPCFEVVRVQDKAQQ